MYDNILRNRENVLETLLIESIDDKQKLVEVFKVLSEILNHEKRKDCMDYRNG